MSWGDDIARLALRLRRRLTWSQIGLGAVSVVGLVIGLGGLVEAVGLAPRDPLVEDVSTGSLLAGALVIYAAAGWGLAWVVARGDRALAVKRLPLVLTGGVLHRRPRRGGGGFAAREHRLGSGRVRRQRAIEPPRRRARQPCGSGL